MQHGQSPPVPTLHRTLHAASLQQLGQSPDGALFPQALPNLHAGAAIYQQHHQYALSGPPQPQPHALQYLPGSPVQYAPFPVSYHHDASPLPVSGGIPGHHFQGPPRPTHRKAPLPPVPNAPQHAPQQEQPQSAPLGRDADDAPASGQFQGLRLVAEPPDLEAWRQKLFDVDDTITLNEDE